MAALGSLVVRLALEYSQYTQGLDKSDQKALQFAKNVQDSMAQAERATVSFVGGIVSGAVAAVASYQTISGVVDHIRESINKLDEVSKTSVRFGIAADELQALALGGELADVKLESLATSAKKLSTEMAQAAAGSKEQAALFEALGISVKNVDGTLRSTTDVLGDIADEFERLPDGPLKTALAVQLFGKAGADMITLLNAGRKSFEESREEAKKYGLIIGLDVLKASEDFNDNLTRLGLIQRGTWNAISQGVLPVMSAYATAAVAAASDTHSVNQEAQRLAGDGSITEWAKAGIEGLSHVADAAEGVWRVLKAAGQSIGALLAAGAQGMQAYDDAFTALKRGDFASVGESFARGAREIKSTLGDLGDNLDKTFGDELFGAKVRARVGDLKAFTAATADAAKREKDAADASKKAHEAELAARLALNKAGGPHDDAKAWERLAAEILKAIEAGEKLGKTLAERNADMQQQIDLGRQLTEAEKQQNDLTRKLSDSTVIMTKAQQDATRAQIAHGDQLRKDFEWQQATAKENAAAAEAIDKQTAAYEQQAAKYDEERNNIGRTKYEIEQLAVSRMRDVAASKEQLAAAFEAGNPDIAQRYRDEAAAILSAADARYKLARANNQEDTRKASEQEAKAAYEEWSRWNDQIGQSLADALMDGGRSARDYLKGMFRNLVLTPLIKSAFAPLTGAVAAFATGSAAAGTGSGVVNGINAASALGNVYSAATGYSAGLSSLAAYLGAGQTAGASAASLGYANLVGAAGGDSLGALIAANGSWSGVAAGSSLGAAAAGEGVAAGSGAAAAAGASGASASSLVATLGPYAVIALALLAIFGDFSKFSLGTVAEGKVIAGKLKNFQFGDAGLQFGNNPEKARGGQLQSAVDLYGGGLASTAAYLGGNANGLGLSIATDLDREGKIAAIVRLLSDSGSLIGGTQTGSGAFSGAPTAAAEKIGADKIGEWFTQNLPVIIVQGLQQSTLPQRFQDFFGSVAADALTPETAQAMLDTATNVQKLTSAFKPLGGVFTQFESLAVDAFKGIADAAGGFDALGQSVANYYQTYYSASEQLADSTDALGKSFSDIGLAMPDLSHGADAARASFRALVDAQDLSTDAGRAAFAGLINISGAFSELANASDAAAKAEQERQDKIKGTNLDLELELMQALGNDSAALALQRQKELDALREVEAATGVAAGTFTDLKEQIYAVVDAAKAAADASAQLAKVDSVAPDFLSGSDLTDYRLERIRQTLAAGGIINNDTQFILNATKDDILALWQAVGPDGKDAILEAYGAWKQLQQSLADAQIADLIDGIASSADDLMSAYNEINPSADNLVDSWRKNKNAMDELKDALDEIAGTKAKSALDTLRDTIAARDALVDVISQNNEQILQLKAGQGGQKAVDALKAREAELWNDFARTGSSSTAQALTRITLQRIQAEGKLQEDSQQKLNDAAYQAQLSAYNLQKEQYDAQKQAAQDQIDAAKRIQDLAKGIPEFLGSLRAGNLSNLSYTGRLAQQKTLFEDSLKTGIDPQSQLTAYLQQAQQIYGGATAEYSAIFTQALAQYQSAIEEQAAKAPDTIALAQAQLDALEQVAPKLETAIVDTSDAQIAALGSLNDALSGNITDLNDSITEQTKILQDQLTALTATVSNQESQITQAGEAYRTIIENQQAIIGELRETNSNRRLDAVLVP